MSNPCADCTIDVDSHYCQYQCRNNKHKEQFKKQPNLTLFPTVSAGRAVVKGSEDTDFDKPR